MFEITEYTEARLASVTNRTEKHGDEEVPAVSLSVEITAANTLLDVIDPSIRHALYKAAEGQEQLPGMEPTTPVLRCNSFDIVALTTAHDGWRLLVDDGFDETAPMEFHGVKVDKLRVDAKQGGTVIVKVRLGTSDVDASRLGKLGMHNGQLIWVKVLKPEPKADAIDGTTAAFEADHPQAGADAGDLFAAEHGGTPDEADSEGGESDLRAEAEREEGVAWPFPTGDNQFKHDQGAAEQAELEAGMSASIQAAGLQPKGRRPRRTAGAVE
jgi:hypothetical protein